MVVLLAAGSDAHVMAAHRSEGKRNSSLQTYIAGAADSLVPLFGSRNKVRGVATLCVKSNMVMMLPSVASFEPWPMRVPPSQLSSMNFTTDDWLICTSSTKLAFAYGEITRNGMRVPGPQRPCTAEPFTPTPCTDVPATLHVFGPFNASEVENEAVLGA